MSKNYNSLQLFAKLHLLVLCTVMLQRCWGDVAVFHSQICALITSDCNSEKKLLKLVYRNQSYCKNKWPSGGRFFGSQCIWWDGW